MSARGKQDASGPDPGQGSPVMQTMVLAGGMAQLILLLGLVGAAMVHRLPGTTWPDVWRIVGATLAAEALWDVAAVRWVRRAMAAARRTEPHPPEAPRPGLPPAEPLPGSHSPAPPAG